MVHRTLNDRTYQEIWDLIISGELALGTRLDERQIADRLQVSRTPVREAINRLVQDRVVVRSPYRGNFVTELRKEQVSDLYLVRKVLESLAVRLALPQMTDADLQHCADLVARGEDALRASDLETYGACDEALHAFVITKSDNEPLKNLLESISREVQLVRAYGNRQPHIAEDAAANRHALIQAMLARDTNAAAAQLEKHIDDVRLSVIANLDDAKPPGRDA